MPNPFRPGTVYYADVPDTDVRDHESRNNPDKGPRPWSVLYCRQHARTGVILAAPLYTKGDESLASHLRCGSEDFDSDSSALIQPSYIHLEQLRALDKTRLSIDTGPLGHMKKLAFQKVRAAMMGMFEPRLLPRR